MYFCVWGLILGWAVVRVYEKGNERSDGYCSRALAIMIVSQAISSFKYIAANGICVYDNIARLFCH